MAGMDTPGRPQWRLQIDFTERRARNLVRWLTERQDMIAGDPADDAELATMVAYLNHRVTRKFGPAARPGD